MTEQLEISAITLQLEGRITIATFELTARLNDEDSYELGIEYRERGEMHRVAQYRVGGVTEARSWSTHGGTLAQSTETFDVSGNVVELRISRPFTAAEIAEFEPTGYFDVNGSRQQSDVLVSLV